LADVRSAPAGGGGGFGFLGCRFAAAAGTGGVEFFGGGEVTFAGLPHFALSADMGYRKMPAEIAAFESRRLRFALSGHWFVR
jgi:hypothetical protein